MAKLTPSPHWTERSTEDFLYKIAADFVQQIENFLHSSGGNQNALADTLGVTPGRVSQVLNSPGNLTLKKCVEYARALGKKVAIVSYDDNDPTNAKGPINSQVFEQCWIQRGRPADFFSLQEANNLTYFVLKPEAPPTLPMPLRAFNKARANNGARSFGIDKTRITDPDQPPLTLPFYAEAENG